METMFDKLSKHKIEDGSRPNSASKAKGRHVQINSNLDTNSKYKKQYDPLEIQVTFNNEDRLRANGNNRGGIKGDKITNLLTKSERFEAKNEEKNDTDDLANLLARIHQRDDDTVNMLTSRVEYLMSELSKRNAVIFSLLKHIDFCINQDISTVRTNKQLNEYLNNNKEVYIKDVISSSRWSPTENESERISEDDWQLDVFQYMKNHIDNIDTILLPAAEENRRASTDDMSGTENDTNCCDNETADNAFNTHCSKHRITTLPPPQIPKIDTDLLSAEDARSDEPVWPEGTIAVIGDNLLHGIDEKRLGGKNWNVKVRMFPESHASDFFHYVTPILNKKPAHVVFHIGTNDAPHYTPRDIFDSVMSLKRYVEKTLPTCNVIISKPIIRMDNCQANLTILKLNQLLDGSKALTIDNGNFGLNHLSKKGPNLNPKGTARLAMNIISQLKNMLSEGGILVPISMTEVSHATDGTVAQPVVATVPHASSVTVSQVTAGTIPHASGGDVSHLSGGIMCNGSSGTATPGGIATRVPNGAIVVHVSNGTVASYASDGAIAHVSTGTVAPLGVSKLTNLSRLNPTAKSFNPLPQE